MGNSESTPRIGGRLSSSRKRSQLSIDGSVSSLSSSTTMSSSSSSSTPLPPLPKTNVTDDSGYVALSERDVAFLCSLTDFSSDEIIRWHKKFFRDYPSGRLDRTGFRKFYCLLQNESPERLGDMCDHIFRAFDIDKNGYVEFGEFLLGFAMCSSGDLQKRLTYAFDCYDIDSSGYLSQKEIELVLRSMYNVSGIKHVEDYPPESMAKDIMKKIDPSNSGKVSRDEFIHALMKDGACRHMMNPFH